MGERSNTPGARAGRAHPVVKCRGLRRRARLQARGCRGPDVFCHTARRCRVHTLQGRRLAHGIQPHVPRRVHAGSFKSAQG